MALKRGHKVSPRFNMASMTDVVFLLLLFFMISSTLIHPGASPLSLPGSPGRVADHPRVTVTIDRDIVFYLNGKSTPFSLLESRLVDALRDSPSPVISLQAEKSVPVEQVIKVMNIARKHDYRVTLATIPG